MTLLNNLKVQERQNRVCTTVAIAIVAESCQPFTVLPALMNEYRTPELNVQNGVLKVRPCGRVARGGALTGGRRCGPKPAKAARERVCHTPRSVCYAPGDPAALAVAL